MVKNGHNGILVSMGKTIPNKPKLDAIINVSKSIRQHLIAIRDARANQMRVSELEKELAEAIRFSRTDALTGVLNRVGLDDVIEDITRDSHLIEHEGKRACVLVLDLDGFKPINDIYGHQAGDELLKQVFKDLSEIKVSSGELHFARTGGDEGIAVFYDMRPRLIELSNHPAERRGTQLSFEEYAIGVVHEKVKEIADRKYEVTSKDGTRVLVNVGISDGYAIVEDMTPEGIQEGIRLADIQSQARKYGLDDFLAIADKDPEVKQYAKEVLGFGIDLGVEGGYHVEREIPISALAQDARFQEFNARINDRARKWLFPQLSPQRAQGPANISR